MSAVSATPSRGWSLAAINERYHRLALNVFLAVVLAHWAEHLVQAYQVWVLDRPRPERGAEIVESGPGLALPPRGRGTDAAPDARADPHRQGGKV